MVTMALLLLSESLQIISKTPGIAGNFHHGYHGITMLIRITSYH